MPPLSSTLFLPLLPVCVCAKSSGPQIVWASLMRFLFLCGILSLWREKLRNSTEAKEREREQVLSLHPPTPPLWVPGLWPIRPISNNKTQENTTKPGRQAGRQVVNGGRNCYLSHWQEQRKHSPECCRKNLYLPVFSILQLNSLLQFPVGWRLQRDFSTHCSGVEACKVVCYVINQVWDRCREATTFCSF